MTQGAAYGGKDQALINIRPRLPRIKLDHRSGRFLVAPSIRLGSPARFACHFGKSPDLLGPPEIRIYRALVKGGRFAADSTLEQSGFEL
jgi:hypothetical protein